MQSRTVTKIGMGVTAIYLIAMGVYIWSEWVHLLAMKPSEFGDFLAGVFGPLAIFWLVCGYLQQGVELQQNTQALKLQADELKHSTRALEYQVEELKNSVQQQTRIAELAAEQLQIEVRRMQRAEEEDIARFEPRFDITSSVMYGASAPAIGEITVINSGASVVVNQVGTNFEDDALPNVLEWPTGITCKFLPFRADRPPALPVKITVRYRQANGLQRTMTLFMADLGDGTFGSAEILEENRSQPA